MRSSVAAIIVAVVFAVVIKIIVDNGSAPVDDTIGTVTVCTHEELNEHFSGKSALVIGGTRGVGYGTALAMATAGARVTVVGRSEKSGALAIDRITSSVSDKAGNHIPHFIQGDIGTVRGANALITTLATDQKKYDFFVVSAATFPDWNAPLLNEDGIDKSFAISVVGRYMVYRNMYRFLNDNARVLNVLASGMKPVFPFDRDLASGQRNVTDLISAMMNFALGNEIMQIGLQAKDDNVRRTTRVSTHPGLLKTDLHKGQGILFDILESVITFLFGITEEKCGVRQASILISDRLHEGGLSYVDKSMLGRVASSELQDEVNEHLEWLWSLLTKLEGQTTEIS